MIFVVSGGGTKLFAAICVIYPSGSTCTCTGNGKTWTAKDTSGQYVFAVPATGTYTVTSGSKSQSVSITAEGQGVVVNLASKVLFDGGDVGSESGGWELTNTNYGNALTIGTGLVAVINDRTAGSAVRTKSKIALAGANSITAVVSGVTVTNVQNGYLRLAIFNDGGAEVAVKDITADGTVSLPVDAYQSGSYYVGFAARAGDYSSVIGMEYPTKFTVTSVTVE